MTESEKTERKQIDSEIVIEALCDKIDELQTKIDMLREEKFQTNVTCNEYSRRLEKGRDYLMGVLACEIKAEDALEAFGFGRSGYGE